MVNLYRAALDDLLWEFNMNEFELERRISKLERAIFNKCNRQKFNENISLNTFDCERLGQTIKNNLLDYDVDIDINEDNADNGFINIGISYDEYEDDYDVIADNYNFYKVLNNDKLIGKFKTFNEVADAIANHFENLYLN